MFIKYTGTADFKSYTAADFKKGGLTEGKKVTFTQGEPTEVPDEVGQALVDKEGFFGPEFFEEVPEDELPEALREAEADNEDGETPWVERVDDEGGADARTKTSSSDANVTTADANVTAAEAKSTTTKAPRSKSS